MIEHPYRVGGDETVTRFVETDNDFGEVEDWAHMHPGILGLDTETTGLDIYSADYRCRLVQIGTAREAWVIPVERFHGRLVEWFDHAAHQQRKFVAHNAPFDLLVLDRVGIASLDNFGPLVFDTRQLAHLLDPRTAQEGGTGHGLKALSAIYVDPDAPDTAAGLDKVFLSIFRAWGKTVDAEEVAAYRALHPKRPHIPFGFTNIDIDHPLYVLYAGLDVILASRLLVELSTLIRANGLGPLAKFEARVALAGARLQRRGMLIDVPYTEKLVSDLSAEHDRQVARAARYGVANVNAPAQVAAALLGMGEDMRERTDSGAPSTAKEVLLPMADLDKEWERLGVREPNPLADAVVRAKRAAKWRESYAQAFLSGRDPADRIHASLNVLAARTARMSVSNPPLQQLPSGDWQIRRAIIADPGQTLVSADYSSVELRVLAALANVRTMKRLIAEGADLHTATARMVYGDAFDQADPKTQKAMRKRVKAVGLGKVYGGGITGLARQTGLPVDAVREAVQGYDKVYPEVNEYGRRLQRDAARSGGLVVTGIGRHLPLDRDRAYAATNYVVQSTARDVMARAMLRLEDAGLGEHLLLPIHDQMLAQFPSADAEEGARVIGEVMRETLDGVPIDTDAEVVGPSWGHAYGAPE